jgi:tetratricopeptide (TPR) repeat protein
MGALGKHLEKIKVFEETTRIQPSFAGGHFKLGVAHAALERHQEAGESYKLVLKIDIDYPLARYFMALS